MSVVSGSCLSAYKTYQINMNVLESCVEFNIAEGIYSELHKNQTKSQDVSLTLTLIQDEKNNEIREILKDFLFYKTAPSKQKVVESFQNLVNLFSNKALLQNLQIYPLRQDNKPSSISGLRDDDASWISKLIGNSRNVSNEERAEIVFENGVSWKWFIPRTVLYQCVTDSSTEFPRDHDNTDSYLTFETNLKYFAKKIGESSTQLQKEISKYITGLIQSSTYPSLTLCAGRPSDDLSKLLQLVEKALFNLHEEAVLFFMWSAIELLKGKDGIYSRPVFFLDVALKNERLSFSFHTQRIIERLTTFFRTELFGSIPELSLRKLLGVEKPAEGFSLRTKSVMAAVDEACLLVLKRCREAADEEKSINMQYQNLIKEYLSTSEGDSTASVFSNVKYNFGCLRRISSNGAVLIRFDELHRTIHDELLLKRGTFRQKDKHADESCFTEERWSLLTTVDAPAKDQLRECLSTKCKGKVDYTDPLKPVRKLISAQKDEKVSFYKESLKAGSNLVNQPGAITEKEELTFASETAKEKEEEAETHGSPEQEQVSKSSEKNPNDLANEIKKQEAKQQEIKQQEAAKAKKAYRSRYVQSFMSSDEYTKLMKKHPYLEEEPCPGVYLKEIPLQSYVNLQSAMNVLLAKRNITGVSRGDKNVSSQMELINDQIKRIAEDIREETLRTLRTMPFLSPRSDTVLLGSLLPVLDDDDDYQDLLCQWKKRRSTYKLSDPLMVELVSAIQETVKDAASVFHHLLEEDEVQKSVKIIRELQRSESEINGRIIEITGENQVSHVEPPARKNVQPEKKQSAILPPAKKAVETTNATTITNSVQPVISKDGEKEKQMETVKRETASSKVMASPSTSTKAEPTSAPMTADKQMAAPPASTKTESISPRVTQLLDKGHPATPKKPSTSQGIKKAPSTAPTKTPKTASGTRAKPLSNSVASPRGASSLQQLPMEGSTTTMAVSERSMNTFVPSASMSLLSGFKLSVAPPVRPKNRSPAPSGIPMSSPARSPASVGPANAGSAAADRSLVSARFPIPSSGSAVEAGKEARPMTHPAPSSSLSTKESDRLIKAPTSSGSGSSQPSVAPTPPTSSTQKKTSSYILPHKPSTASSSPTPVKATQPSAPPVRLNANSRPAPEVFSRKSAGTTGDLSKTASMSVTLGSTYQDGLPRQSTAPSAATASASVQRSNGLQSAPRYPSQRIGKPAVGSPEPKPGIVTAPLKGPQFNSDGKGTALTEVEEDDNGLSAASATTTSHVETPRSHLSGGNRSPYPSGSPSSRNAGGKAEAVATTMSPGDRPNTSTPADARTGRLDHVNSRDNVGSDEPVPLFVAAPGPRRAVQTPESLMDVDNLSKSSMISHQAEKGASVREDTGMTSGMSKFHIVNTPSLRASTTPTRQVSRWEREMALAAMSAEEKGRSHTAETLRLQEKLRALEMEERSSTSYRGPSTVPVTPPARGATQEFSRVPPNSSQSRLSDRPQSQPAVRTSLGGPSAEKPNTSLPSVDGVRKQYSSNVPTSSHRTRPLVSAAPTTRYGANGETAAGTTPNLSRRSLLVTEDSQVSPTTSIPSEMFRKETTFDKMLREQQQTRERLGQSPSPHTRELRSSPNRPSTEHSPAKGSPSSKSPMATRQMSPSKGTKTSNGRRQIDFRSVNSLAGIYNQACKVLGVRQSSALLRIIPDRPGEYISTMDLSINYIGIRGLAPVYYVLEHNMSCLQVLNLSGNNMENKDVSELLEVLQNGAGKNLVELDLSYNPITQAGGQAILNYLTSSPRIKKVHLLGTLIPPKIMDGITTLIKSRA